MEKGIDLHLVKEGNGIDGALVYNFKMRDLDTSCICGGKWSSHYPIPVARVPDH